LEKLFLPAAANHDCILGATASTTLEEEVGRFVGDDEKYNVIAARVMQKHGIAIDDLFALTKGFAGRFSKRAGDVCYTAAGDEKIAAQVTSSIEKMLPTKIMP